MTWIDSFEERLRNARLERLGAEMACLRAMVTDLKSYYALRRQAARLRSETLRLASQRALQRFDLAYARFFDEEKAGFNPDQPRVPAGNPDGGQWIGIGGQDATRVRLAQTDRLAGYPVDLRDEEARGGHTIEKHVNKSPEALDAQVFATRICKTSEPSILEPGPFPHWRLPPSW